MNIEKAEFLVEQMLKGTWHLVRTPEGRALITPEPTDTTIETIEGGPCHPRIVVTVSRVTQHELIGRIIVCSEEPELVTS